MLLYEIVINNNLILYQANLLHVPRHMSSFILSVEYTVVHVLVIMEQQYRLSPVGCVE